MKKIYKSQLGALTEHHVIFHTKGAEKKMNFALKLKCMTIKNWHI